MAKNDIFTKGSSSMLSGAKALNKNWDELLYAFTDSIPNGLIAVNQKGFVCGCNKQAINLVNIQVEKIYGKHIKEVLPGSPLEAVLLTGKAFYGKTEKFGKNYLTGDHIPLFDSSNILIGACSIYHKHTSNSDFHLEIEEAREKGRELDAILEWSHDGIWIMDGKGVTLRVSKSWEDFAGIKREKMIGRSVYDIVKEGYYSDSAAIHVMQELKPVNIIYETRTGRRALVTGNPVFNEDGSLWRIVSNIRDITELMSIREELEKTQGVAQRFQEEIRLLREQQLRSDGVIIRSQKMVAVIDLAGRAAQSDATVLVMGDSGTGKEVVARLIHKLSKRSEGPYIKINCGAIPETLLESELFGYEGGSFTGARRQGKPGLFEMAEGGTLFLDEIGEMPLQLQSKLLLAIQDRQIYRVGGTVPLDLNVRIVAATNRDLQAMVAEGKFRGDLYYRLNVIPLLIPPLSERKEDIIPLAFFYFEKFNKKYNFNKRYSPRVVELMSAYSWPGNVRELENLTERLVVTSPGEEIGDEQLPECFNREINITGIASGEVVTLKKATENLEKILIKRALKQCGTTRKAAVALGISQPSVVRKAKKYGLQVND